MLGGLFVALDESPWVDARKEKASFGVPAIREAFSIEPNALALGRERVVGVGQTEERKLGSMQDVIQGKVGGHRSLGGIVIEGTVRF